MSIDKDGSKVLHDATEAVKKQLPGAAGASVIGLLVWIAMILQSLSTSVTQMRTELDIARPADVLQRVMIVESKIERMREQIEDIFGNGKRN